MLIINFLMNSFKHCQYEIQIFAENKDGMLYNEPLELLLTVMDENDNGPVFSQEIYQVELEENTAKGESCLSVASQEAKCLWWPTCG